MPEGTSVPARTPIACRHCASSFTPKRRVHVFCLVDCQQKHRAVLDRERRIARPKLTWACRECGEEFEPQRKTRLYCSRLCGIRARAKTVRAGEQLGFAVCRICQSPFMPHRDWHEFCSQPCRNKASHVRVKARKTIKMCRTCYAYLPREDFPEDGAGLNCAVCMQLKADGRRRCGECKKIKTFADFNRHGGKGSGLQGRCRECARENQAIRSQDPVYQRRSRNNRLLRTFGITADQFDELLARQGGGCAMCGDAPTDESFHVDHDHACCPGSRMTCGRCIRGILCRHCNQALGFLRDSIERAEAAIAYLRAHAS